MKIKGIEVPEHLNDAIKEINKLYYEANKEHIREAQRKYKLKPKTEEDKQKIREYANNYYQTKLKEKYKEKRIQLPKTEEEKQKIREYANNYYHTKLKVKKQVEQVEKVEEVSTEDI